MLEKSTFTVTFNLFYTLKQVTGFREKKEKLQEAADVPGLSQTQNTRGRLRIISSHNHTKLQIRLHLQVEKLQSER